MTDPDILAIRDAHLPEQGEAKKPETVERCPCGFPMPCALKVPIQFCKSHLKAPA